MCQPEDTQNVAQRSSVVSPSVAKRDTSGAVDVVWKDLTVKYGDKVALDNAGGFVQGGSLVAVMGRTGAGKTTLLQALADYNTVSNGYVLYNGKELRLDSDMEKSVGFVDQDDIFIGAMTVFDGLMEQALFHTADKKLARQKVEQVLEQLKISAQAKQTLDSVSGGQRKRFCIARELLGDPTVLFCDESTSGLDSALAKVLVHELRALVAKNNTTVIMSIQQPSEEIYSMCDMIMLLDEGKVFYYGPPQQALTHFQRFSPEKLEYDDDLPNFLMHMINKNLFDRDAAHSATSIALTQPSDFFIVRKSGYVASARRSERKRSSNFQRLLESTSVARIEKLNPMAQFFRNVHILMRRIVILEFWNVISKNAFLLSICSTFIAAWIFFRPDLTAAGLETRTRAQVWMTGLPYWAGVYGGIMLLGPTTHMLTKDLRCKNYTVVQFWLARCFGSLWLYSIWPLFSTSMFYLIVWPNPTVLAMFFILLQVIVSVSTGIWFGLLISLIFSYSNMMLFTHTYTHFALIWCIFFGSEETYLPWLKWITKLSNYSYLYEMQMYTVFTEDLVFPCLDAANPQGVPCPDGITGEINGRQLIADRSILKFDNSEPVAWIVLVCGFGVGSLVLGQLMIWFNNRIAIYGPNASRKPYDASNKNVTFQESNSFEMDPNAVLSPTKPMPITQDPTTEPTPRDTRPTPRNEVFEGPNVCVTIEDLRVEYAADKPPAVKNVSFGIPAGTTTALMGPSGSGKTTTIHAILNKIPNAVTNGKVLYNGMPWQSRMRQYFGFVEQDDITISGLTIRQGLRFTAKLRIRDTSIHEDRISKLLTDLQLNDCADMPIEAVSAGQRKRACMARELLGQPLVLILDEPTSSLDSTMAEELCDTMNTLAHKYGMTIIASIHQPSQAIFRSFDHVHLLREGTQMYYGCPHKVLPFYKSFGLERQRQNSAAEFMLDLMVLENQMSQEQIDEIEKFALENGNNMVKQVKGTMQLENSADLEAGERSPMLENGDSMFPPRHSPTWIQRTLALWYRMLAMEFKMYFGMSALFNLLLLMFVQTLRLFNVYNRPDLQQNVFVYQTLTLWLANTWVLNPFVTSIFKYFGYSTILTKELSNSSHDLSSFYVARLVLMHVYDFIWAFVFQAISFWMILPIPDVGACIQVVLLSSTILCFLSRSIAFTLSYVTKFKDIILILVVFLTFTFTWNPFFLPDGGSLPDEVLWLRYLSIVTYGYSAMVHLIFNDNLEFDCSIQKNRYEKVYKACEAVCPDYAPGCTVTGTQMIEYKDMSVHISYFTAVMVVVGAATVVSITGYFLLRFKLRSVFKAAKSHVC